MATSPENLSTVDGQKCVIMWRRRICVMRIRCYGNDAIACLHYFLPNFIYGHKVYLSMVTLRH